MKWFALPIALGIAVFAPGLALASPAIDSTGVDSLCDFNHHIDYQAKIRPLHPCGGDALTLVVESCAECDDVVSGLLSSTGGVELRFESRQFCPRIVCRPDSVEIPLGRFAAGHYQVMLNATAHVTSDSTTGCFIRQLDPFAFDVGRCTPPPDGTLPFVQTVRIGNRAPCIECPPVACPGESLLVRVSGEFPDLCHSFAGLALEPNPIVGPEPEPPVLRVLVDVCNACPCAQQPRSFAGAIMIPPLPPRSYLLPAEEVWLDHSDSSRVDTTFNAAFPFTVVERCSTVTPPEPCFLADWVHSDGLCDASVDRQHLAQVTLDLHATAPLAGLQGRLNLYPPGLAVIDMHPVGVAANMKLAWTGTQDGAKFVLFSTDSSVIPPPPLDSTFASVPILRVGVVPLPGGTPASITYVTANTLVASDPNGNQIPECPILTLVQPAARICFESRQCDFNHDGAADVRDLVLMVHCILGTGPCPDSSTAPLDCNHDGKKSLDDVLCCAGVILREGLPDTTKLRHEPEIRVSFGRPALDGTQLDIPVRVAGADRVGAARLSLRFPSDRFDVTGIDPVPGVNNWLALHEVDGANLVLGLIGLSPGSGGDGSGAVEFTLHLALKPGQQPAGDLTLATGDFSGPDGVALGVDLANVTVPIGDVPRLELSAPQPNPFSRATQFSVTVPRAAVIEVRVHDLAGRRVATLFRGRLDPGTRAFSWAGSGDDGARVRDGIYFVRVQGAGDDVTRKVILLRAND